MSQLDPVTGRGRDNHRGPAPDADDDFDDEVLGAFDIGDSDQDDDFADLVDRLRRAEPPTTAPRDPGPIGGHAEGGEVDHTTSDVARRSDVGDGGRDAGEPAAGTATGGSAARGGPRGSGERGDGASGAGGAGDGPVAIGGLVTGEGPGRVDDARRAGTATAGLVAAVARRAEDDGLLDVAWTLTDSPVGPLTLAATPAGLVRIAFGHEDAVLDELADRVSPRVLEAPARLDAVRRQLDEYFAGRRQQFEIDLDWSLSQGFRRTVLHKLVEVPYGHTLSYKELAELAGNPKASRATGTAMATNPIPLVVPCHRVLRSGGKLGGYGGGLDAKVWLLRLEGHPLLA